LFEFLTAKQILNSTRTQRLHPPVIDSAHLREPINPFNSNWLTGEFGLFFGSIAVLTSVSIQDSKKLQKELKK
jgi:hypothetical protein